MCVLLVFQCISKYSSTCSASLGTSPDWGGKFGFWLMLGSNSIVLMYDIGQKSSDKYRFVKNFLFGYHAFVIFLQPIVVMAASPSVTCACVQALVK
jgi:hypothetical protein